MNYEYGEKVGQSSSTRNERERDTETERVLRRNEKMRIFMPTINCIGNQRLINMHMLRRFIIDSENL